ncbi:hypothetical protein RJT34_24136 [Clitoria ternatea]|uniref:Uncharacterized protein n=1 Tax=Clitoria ternatea TaxID=43366 RepID=A0AAN9FMB1_CLITE
MEKLVEREREKELDSIKEQYLSSKKAHDYFLQSTFRGHLKLNNKVVEMFLERPKDVFNCSMLFFDHLGDDVVERVAQHLRINGPSKIRLTSYNCCGTFV